MSAILDLGRRSSKKRGASIETHAGATLFLRAARPERREVDALEHRWTVARRGARDNQIERHCLRARCRQVQKHPA